MSQVTRKLRDQILVLKIRHGDAAAYAQVYDLYVAAIFRYIVFRVPTEDIAQDLTSELFLRVWERLRQGSGTVSNLRAYLYQVARHLVADHFRQEQPIPLLDNVAVTDREAAARTGSQGSEVTLADIEAAVRQLKPEWQEVVILAHIEGLSVKEVAAIIGKSHGATRVMIHRALQELKKFLN